MIPYNRLFLYGSIKFDMKIVKDYDISENSFPNAKHLRLDISYVTEDKAWKLPEANITVCNDFYSNYKELLVHLIVQGIKLMILAIEVFKSINIINPPYTKELFVIKEGPYAKEEMG